MNLDYICDSYARMKGIHIKPGMTIMTSKDSYLIVKNNIGHLYGVNKNFSLKSLRTLLEYDEVLTIKDVFKSNLSDGAILFNRVVITKKEIAEKFGIREDEISIEDD